MPRFYYIEALPLDVLSMSDMEIQRSFLFRDAAYSAKLLRELYPWPWFSSRYRKGLPLPNIAASLRFKAGYMLATSEGWGSMYLQASGPCRGQLSLPLHYGSSYPCN